LEKEVAKKTRGELTIIGFFKNILVPGMFLCH